MSRTSSLPRPALRARLSSIWPNFQEWFTGAPRATVGFSVLRILFAVGMLAVLLPSFADRQYLWGAGSWWVEPEASRRGWWSLFRAIFPKDNPVMFDVLYVVLIALVVVFLIGWQTRWVTPILLVIWVGLSTNSTLLTNGGDTLMRIVLLFAIFADLSRHLSVDAWLRRRRERRSRPPRRALLPAWLSASMHNTALILCCYQILLVYLVSSILKLQGEEWLQGTALYYALSLKEFQVMPGLSEIAWQSTPGVMLATWSALLFQLLFPVMLLWRRTRYISVIALTMTHLGIAVLLGLWPFSLAMIALDLLLIRDASWVRAVRMVRSVISRIRHVASGDVVAADRALRDVA